MTICPICPVCNCSLQFDAESCEYRCCCDIEWSRNDARRGMDAATDERRDEISMDQPFWIDEPPF
jgi:hypothetical protein